MTNNDVSLTLTPGTVLFLPGRLSWCPQNVILLVGGFKDGDVLGTLASKATSLAWRGLPLRCPCLQIVL